MDNTEHMNEENREQTQMLSAIGEEPIPAPRRRRSDRYHMPETAKSSEHAAGEAGSPESGTERLTLRADSETAREVARRFRIEEQDGSRREAVRGATSRAGMLNAARIRENAGKPETAGMNPGRNAPGRDRVGYAPGQMGIGNTDRGRMSEESRARLADENRRALRAAYESSQREIGGSYSGGQGKAAGNRNSREAYGRNPKGRDPRMGKTYPDAETEQNPKKGQRHFARHIGRDRKICI